jgi:integrase/recombinase XerD
MRIKLKVNEWPTSDQEFWASLLKKGHPLDDAGALSHLRASTVQPIEVGYGRWLSWLEITAPSTWDLPIWDRATPERIMSWMQSMQHLAPYSRVMHLDALIWILRAIYPAADVTILRRIRAAHHFEALSNSGERKNGRVLSSHVLLEAGLELAGVQATMAKSTFERMRRLRDGTMLAILALMPIRRRAFVGLELGISVLPGNAGVEIALSSEMTKTHTPWSAMVPYPVDDLLRRYLSEARPFLFNRGPRNHARLWVADTGLPIGYSYMGKRIPELTERMTGVRVPPHFFRDAAATTLARESSTASRLAAPVLGHKNIRTAEKHYNHARCIEAGSAYAAMLERRKNS